MPRSVAIAIDGVLRKPLDVEAQDMGGALLYASLINTFRVTVLGSGKPSLDEQFLLVNGFKGYASVSHPRPEETDSPIWNQILRLRRDGERFEFVVLDDPVIARRLIQYGQPVLLYANPDYTSEIFSPITQRSWMELSTEVAERRLKRAEADN